MPKYGPALSDQWGWIGPLSCSRCSVSSTFIHVVSDANSRSVALRPRDLFIVRRARRLTIQPETVSQIASVNLPPPPNIASILLGSLRLLRLGCGTCARQFVGGHKYWFDVRGHAFQPFQRFLHF